jgi:hypothetical protein
MISNVSRRALVLLSALIVQTAGALPAIAQCEPPPGQEARWVSRAYIGRVLSSGSVDAIVQDVRRRVERPLEIQDASGLGVGVDVGRRVTGLEVQLGIHSVDVPLDVVSRATGETTRANGFRFSSLILGAVYHISEQRQFDIYFGPLAAVSSRDVAQFEIEGESYALSSSGTFAGGFQAGVRWPGCTTRGTVAVDVGVRYVGWRFGLSQELRLDSTPWTVMLGVVYRY